MTHSAPRFYFDAVDPLSYVVDLELRALGADVGPVERVPVELRPAPAPLTDTSDPFWADRWARAVQLLAARGSPAEFHIPALIPRSRKAHELFLHAAAHDMGSEVLAGVQHAFLIEGRDVGRVDVLVEIGRGLGLDLTETKAVLDVDKYEDDVLRAAEHARSTGIEPPSVELGPHRLEGFHNQAALRTFLAAT